MSEEQLIQLGQLINDRAKAKFSNNLEFASACDIDEEFLMANKTSRLISSQKFVPHWVLRCRNYYQKSIYKNQL